MAGAAKLLRCEAALRNSSANLRIFVFLRTIRVVAILFSMISFSFAQGRIQGTVSDALGTRIAGAKVTLQHDGVEAGATETDQNGVFSFQNVAPGRYRVNVFASGFEAYTGSEIQLGSSAPANVEAILQVGALKQEIVVTATGTVTPIAQVGASVSVINQEQIQAENKLDALENIRQVAGTQIVQTSQRGGATSLYIRGGESSFNKVLIDGVPANAIGGEFDFAQLSNTGVQNIEVMKGANSVLYGADALAGVVSVTTQRGVTPLPELQYSVDGGNFRTLHQAVSLAGAFRKFDYFSAFSRFDTQGSYQNNFFHNAAYAGNFGYDPNPSTDIRVTLRRAWTGLGSPNAIYLYGISDDSSQKNQNTYLSATVQNQTTSRWHNLLRFGFAQANSTYENPSPSGRPDSFGFGDFLGQNVTIKGANGYQVTGQAILDYAGVYPQIFPDYEARRSLYGQSDYQFYRDWTATLAFRYEHENGSGFTRDNYGYTAETHGSVGRRLFLAAGLGFENNAVFGFAATPRFSAAYYLNRPSATGFFGETKLRFNFGEGIKEPSTFEQGSELFALLTPAQRAQYHVSPVGPERSRAFDFGIDQGLWNGRARLELAYFHNRFYDLITFLNQTALVSIGVDPNAAAAAAAAAFGAYVNATSTKAQGFEAQVAAELGHGLRIQGNYTYLDAVVTKAFGNPVFNPAFPNIPIGAFAPLQGARPFRRAPHTGSLGLLYSRGKFVGTLTGYMVGRRDDSTFLSDALFGNTLLLPNRDLAPAYQKFDLSGRYALRRYVSLFTSIENLFSEHYQAVFGFPAAPLTIRGGVTFTVGGEAWK